MKGWPVAVSGDRGGGTECIRAMDVPETSREIKSMVSGQIHCLGRLLELSGTALRPKRCHCCKNFFCCWPFPEHLHVHELPLTAELQLGRQLALFASAYLH